MRRRRPVLSDSCRNAVEDCDQLANNECIVLLIHFIILQSTLLHLLATSFAAKRQHFFVLDAKKSDPEVNSNFNTPFWDNQQLCPDNNIPTRPLRVETSGNKIIHHQSTRSASTGEQIAQIERTNFSTERTRFRYRNSINTGDNTVTLVY